MIDLVFYSIVEVLTGLAPNYTTFLILRALFGIGMGAEWGVGASLVMEKVPPRLRGVMSGLLQQGYAAGYLLAALCYLLVFPHWGWRPLFFIGGLPALLALFVRARVHESEVWRETRHETWSHLGRAIMSNWRLFLYLTVLMALMNMVSHGTQDMYPTFLERDWGFEPRARAAVTAFSQVGALARVPGASFRRTSTSSLLTACGVSCRGSRISAAWRSRARSHTYRRSSPHTRATRRPWPSRPRWCSSWARSWRYWDRSGAESRSGKQILRACGAQDDRLIRVRRRENQECRGAVCCAPTFLSPQIGATVRPIRRQNQLFTQSGWRDGA